MGKGSSMEREIAVKLSLWYSENTSEDLFWRSQASGGRATVRQKKGKANPDQFGDIVAVDKRGASLMKKWSIEVKTGYSSKNKDKKITNWCVLDAIDSRQKQSVLEKFWEQCERDAELSDREPVLIFRRPMMAPCICITRFYYGILSAFFGNCPPNTIELHTNDNNLIIMKLDNFFEWIPNIKAAL